MAEHIDVSTYQQMLFADFVVDVNYYSFNFQFKYNSIGSSGNYTAYSVQPYLQFYVNGIDIYNGVLINNVDFQPITFIFTNDEMYNYLYNDYIPLTWEIISDDFGMRFEFFHNADAQYWRTPVDLLDEMSDYSLESLFDGYYSESILSYSEENFILREVIDNKNDIILDLENDIDSLQQNLNAPGSTFELIADAFTPVFNTLNLQVAPNITLGMLFVVPVVVGVISFIIKEFTK